MVDLVVKMVIDHKHLGDVMVNMMNIPKSYMNTYPPADDAQHVIKKQLALPAPQKGKRTAIDAKGVLTAILGERKAKGASGVELTDALEAAGYKRNSAATKLHTLSGEGFIVMIDKSLYTLPQYASASLQKGSK